MGYFILAPVLLADYKSAIVTCTAADCKSAETERGKSTVGVPADLKSADKKGSTYLFADLKSAETSGGINPR